MKMMIDGIPIEVQKKRIKNMHLYVKPPDGSVLLTAPMRMRSEDMEAFVRAKLDWIRKHRKRFREQPKVSERRYVSGETLSIWGGQYDLTFEESRGRNSFVIQENAVILRMRSESTVKQREAYVRKQYRMLLQTEIERLLPKWESITGLRCRSWQTKYMTTRWGTCNTDKKRLWFNVQLAEKPVECLEYVILHELAHTEVRNHGPKFAAIMDRYMPDWRQVQKRLNSRSSDRPDMDKP